MTQKTRPDIAEWRVLTEPDTLVGGKALSGCSIPVSDIFTPFTRGF